VTRAAGASRRQLRPVPQVRRYKGYVLTRLGRQTVVVATADGSLWGWAASWRQARAVVNWLKGVNR
jgi:hypothetical protein